MFSKLINNDSVTVKLWNIFYLAQQSRTSKTTGPLFTVIKTDKNANFKWLVRHYVGKKYQWGCIQWDVVWISNLSSILVLVSEIKWYSKFELNKLQIFNWELKSFRMKPSVVCENIN